MVVQALRARSNTYQTPTCATLSTTHWWTDKLPVIILGTMLALNLWQAVQGVGHEPDLRTELQTSLIGPIWWITHQVVSKVINWISKEIRPPQETTADPMTGMLQPKTIGSTAVKKSFAECETKTGIFRTWVGTTPAECATIELFYQYLDQEMEEEAAMCARLQSTTCASNLDEGEICDWEAPGGVGEVYDWSGRAQALLRPEHIPDVTSVSVTTVPSRAQTSVTADDNVRHKDKVNTVDESNLNIDKVRCADTNVATNLKSSARRCKSQELFSDHDSEHDSEHRG
jgi:hypothetical protein